MKKPNFDFSKEGIQRFFLYHTEKLVLGVAILLMGLFFWFGFKTPVFSSKSPKQLKQLADSADTFIHKPDAWTLLEEKRQADDTVEVRITNANQKVNLAELLPKYNDGLLTGVPTRTLAKRSDPKILRPIELSIKTTMATVLFNRGNNPLRDLPTVGAVEEDDSRDGRSGRSGPEQSTALNVPEYLQEEAFGVRPDRATSTAGFRNYHVNVVTALIDMDAQWKEFAEFENSIGYYPPRDKPNYRYVEVQRKVDGGEWEDVSKNLDKYSQLYSGNFPTFEVDQLGGTANETKPVAGLTAGPELIAPQHWDPVLCSPIPAFVQFDYRSFINHPSGKIAFREVEAKAEMGDDDDKDSKTSNGFNDPLDDPIDDENAPEMPNRTRGTGVKADDEIADAVVLATYLQDLEEWTLAVGRDVGDRGEEVAKWLQNEHRRDR